VIGDDGKMYFDRFGAKGAPEGGCTASTRAACISSD